MNLGTLVKLAAIVLGVVSATIMAQRGFEISFNEGFLRFLDMVGEFIGIIVLPFELILVRPALRALAALGVEIELHDHWKYAFILVWLFLGSIAKAVASARVPGMTAFGFLWGGFCALLAGVLAGTFPLTALALLWWPVACVGLFFMGSLAANYRQELDVEVFLRLLFFVVMSLGFLTVLIFLIGGSFIQSTPAPGLAALAAFIAGMGAIVLLIGATDDEGAALSRIGLDVLSVLGGAAFLTYVAHSLA